MPKESRRRLVEPVKGSASLLSAAIFWDKCFRPHAPFGAEQAGFESPVPDHEDVV